MVRLGAAFAKRHSTDDPTSVQPQLLYKLNPSTPNLVLQTTTTHEDTHAPNSSTAQFFTLPAWTKRVWNNQNDTTKTKLVPTTGQARAMGPEKNASLMVNKDLPPTPPREDTNMPGFADSGEVAKDGVHPRPKDTLPSYPPNSRKTCYGSDNDGPSSSTNALARASLSVGLSHVLPSASSSSSSVNIIPASSSQPLPTEKPASYKAPRKSHSTQRLKTMLTLDRLPPAPRWPPQEAMTTPGMSSPSASSLLDGFFSATSGKKGKEKAAEPIEISSPPRPITRSSSARRPSFWRRKQEPSEKSAGLEIEVAIPPMPPLSPFDMEMEKHSTVPQPATKAPRSAPGLSRSRSFNAKMKPLDSKSDIGRRPLTADASRRPPKSTPATLSVANSPQVPTHPPASHPDSPRLRQRANTNPTLLNRLSLSINRLSSGSSLGSPWTPSTQSPLQALTGDENKSSSARPSGDGHLETSLTPRKSGVSSTAARIVPKEDDTAETFLERLRTATSRAEIAGVLASSTQSIYTEALRVYMKQFTFHANPLDVALRKLLMETGLPRETQQIDRVMEAFARRYLDCNPGLFANEDHPYILSFSLIMLHTDQFNKSNKRKMTKPDYIKNTSLPNVQSEVLDYFFDNITFAPFIFIEDHIETGKQIPESASSSTFFLPPITPATQSSLPAMRSGKVDPYYMITQNLLDPLRVDMALLIPIDCPLYYYGTSGPWNEADLRQAFANATEVEFSLPDATRTSSFFNRSSSTGLENARLSSGGPDEVRQLKLARAGPLNRRDDVLQNGKKSNTRRWRMCCVALSEGHLIFFRDPSMANQLRPFDGQVPVPRSTVFKPEEAMALKEVVALYDRLYDKHDNTFRVVLPDGRHILLQAPDEAEMNAWIACINYASAFCTAGVRMRPVDLSKADVQLTGVAAAASHLHDLKHRFHSSNSRVDLTSQMETQEQVKTTSSSLQRISLTLSGPEEFDPDVPMAPEIEGADLLKATFDQVKADLAAGRRADADSYEEGSTFLSSSSSRLSGSSLGAENSSLSTRAKFSLARIKRLDSLIIQCESSLAPSLRTARNIAILTPFRKDTRDRLMLSVQRLATEIFMLRVELVKLSCHRHVLLADLSSEERSWHRAKTLALQVATETLHERKADETKRSSQEDIGLPEHALSDGTVSPTGTNGVYAESSIAESFYSALDTNQSSPAELSPSTFLNAERMTDSPEPALFTSRSTSSHMTNGSSNASHSPRPSAISMSRTSSESTSHERFYTAPESPTEVAEEWNRTRAAQRVSLVRVPSEMRMLNRFRQSSGQMSWTMN